MKLSLPIRIAAVLVVVMVGLLIFRMNQPSTAKASNDEMELKAPGFATDARVNAEETESVLEKEAGISAYFKTAQPINLATVRPLYRAIEIETADYIVGSMAVPDNWEEFDVHVYIHKAGWVLAYYLKDEPVIRIFDWLTYNQVMNPTRFQSVLNRVTTTLNLPDPALTYYDFRYPNATNLLLVLENVASGATDAFSILGTDFVYYEANWGLGGAFDYCSGGCVGTSIYFLDGNEIHRNTVEDAQFDVGILTPGQLSPINPHTISIYQSSNIATTGALVILYGPSQ